MKESRIATWKPIGEDVSRVKTLETVLRKSGLDYEVKKQEIYTGEDKKIIVPGQFATVGSNGRVYGIVGKDYMVCQNYEAFDFINYIKDDIKFVKAGETVSGLVYIIAELPEVKVLGDEFKPYVIFQNGHNGGISIKAAICPLRIVCQNQFSMAFAKTKNAVLRGADYETPVNYWMPFNGNVGMHDATWRSSFGGTIYLTSGSHGCVNLPLDMAAAIYEYMSTGFPIVCYYY